MPRKLTIIGVLAALVLGMVGLAQSASANDAQSFCTVGHNPAGTCPAGFNPLDWDVCYARPDLGTPVQPAGPIPPITCGANTSDTVIPLGTGVPLKNWSIISNPIGSRTTLPVTYTPAAFGRTFPATTLTVATGDVTARVDLLCDGGADILARNGSPYGHDPDLGNPTAGGAWPGNGWDPFNFYRDSLLDPNYAYIDQIKPMPFADVSIDVARLTRLWLFGAVGYDLPPGPAQLVTNPELQGSPLVQLDTTSSYALNLHASVSILGGNPSPPNNAYTCLDSPGDSVATQLTLIPPSVAGNYVRWTNFQSAADIVSRQVTRLMIVRCLKVGLATAGTCDLADTDGDGVPNAVEAVNGTNPASADTDADGATDFDESFQFSDPGCDTGTPFTCGGSHPLDSRDTDADGSWDKQDNLSGFNCVPSGGVCTLANLGDAPNGSLGSDDNCPVKINATQANTDSQPDFTQTPIGPGAGVGGTAYRGDATNPHQDHQGDACDGDDDNDGLDDVVEAGFLHTNLAPGSAGGPPSGSLWCLPQGASDPGGGIATVATDPLNPDSDSDGGLDGRECQFGSDPIGAGTGSCNPTCAGNNRFPAAAAGADHEASPDLLFPDAAEVFYRTSHISQGSGAALDDLEQSGSSLPIGSPVCCTLDGLVGANDSDSDGDRLNDGWEVKWYGTSPAAFDTDTDGCGDGTEAADVNGDHRVNSGDAGAITAHTTAGSLNPSPPYMTAGVRRDELATYDINKDGSINSGDSGIAAALTGQCANGIGAQTALPIVIGTKP